MRFLALLVLSAPAWAAPRAVTYEEALTAALDSNPALRRAKLDRDSAKASLRSARGQWDPVLGIDGNWRRSQSKGFFQGFPFDSVSRSWDLGTNVGGTLGTGTNYSLNASMDRNFSSFVTNFGVGASNEQIQDTYTSNLSVSLTQQLLKGLRTSYNLQNVTRARQGLTTADLSLEKARQDALSNTARAYWGWVYQVQLQVIADESVANAEEALRMGLINRLTTVDELEATAREYAGMIAENAPLTVETANMAVNAAISDPDDRDLDAIDAMVAKCFASDDYKEGQTAFMEKRKPNFQGR